MEFILYRIFFDEKYMEFLKNEENKNRTLITSFWKSSLNIKFQFSRKDR